ERLLPAQSVRESLVSRAEHRRLDVAGRPGANAGTRTGASRATATPTRCVSRHAYARVLTGRGWPRGSLACLSKLREPRCSVPAISLGLISRSTAARSI